MNLKTIPQSLWFAGFLLALSVPAAYAQGEAARDFKGKIGFDLKESVEAWPQETRAPRGAPNVIVVLLDDVGYAATSVFGGPVPTPELERLAATGLRYNNFHTTAYCSASRAALLSGRNDHRVGFGVISETVQGFPGYNGIWRKDTTSMPEVLRRNGYSTAAFGKWHNTPPWEITPVGPFDRWPTGLGFEYFYGFMGAQTNQWYPKLYRNTRPASPVKTPEQGYYLNTDLADDAIRWLHVHESQAPDKPYLLYFAPGATHEPLQAPREWIEKYRGRFDGGYDRLRQEIFDRQKKLGVIPANSELTPRPAELPGWDSFSADQKRLMARQMEVYAAFLAHTDHEIGRIIQAAREGPHGDNTLVLFIAGDNGASAEGGFTGYGSSRAQTLGQRLARLDEMGGVVAKGSSLYASGWAYALSSPFQWAKRIASHYGGTTVPLVVSWPARIKDQGGLRPQFSHLNDIAATVLEAAGIAAPEVVDGVKQLPMDGTSLVYSFDQPQAPSTHTLQIFEQVGNRAIYHDGWVAAVRHAFPWNTPQDQNSDFRSDIWELYHVAEDFSQARNLAAQNPEKLKELQALFEAEARKNDIYPLMLRKPTSHPMPNDGRREFVLYPEVADLPRPDFRRPYRITAEVIVPASGAEGVLADSQRGDKTGFVFYVKNDHLVFKISPVDKAAYKLTSRDPIPRGNVVFAFEFIPDAANPDAPGTGRFYVNDQVAGEARMEGFANPGTPRIATFTIGRSSPAPTADSLPLPGPFTGELVRVRVLLK